MMDSHRHDWSVARTRIQARMAELRLGVVDLARASGLSEKHIRTLLNDSGPGTTPRDQTRWALCDALRWTPDSIDRLLDGFDPVDADESGEVSPLAEFAGRLAEIEALVSTGLESDRTQQIEMGKFFRLHRRLEDDVRASVTERVAADSELQAAIVGLGVRLQALETALQELRQERRRGNADSPESRP